MSALFQQAANDPDTLETAEWLDALETVIEREGPERAHFLLEALIDKARRSGTHIPYSANTAYINTIPPHLEEHSPGDPVLEERIRSYIRWNSMAMVVRANRGEGDLGGRADLAVQLSDDEKAHVLCSGNSCVTRARL